MDRRRSITADTASSRAASKRSFRVFVSSTFRDMHQEREILIKRVFTRLRMLCEERCVGWAEVDLRWGITSEDAERGKVVPICLAEITRSDLLIVLLGERYGWVPASIEPQLIDEYPWLAQCGGDSLTEIEIKHGALNRPTVDDRALFYFRDPKYLDRLPCGSHRPDFLPENEAAQRKLCELKARIRASGYRVRESYADPAELAELLSNDLTDYLAKHHPEGLPGDTLERESTAHLAFAVSRSKVFFGRRREFARLNAHVEGSGLPITMVGDSGSGKSALVANWADQLIDRRGGSLIGLWDRLSGWSNRYTFARNSERIAQAAQPPIASELVIEHYVGASPQSADWEAMLRRIMGELQKHLDLKGEIPGDSMALRSSFGEQLNRAADRARVILVIDGVDQLEDRDHALDLAWVPPDVPVNVRLVLSTAGGRTLEEIQRRRWPTMELKPLPIDERIEVINRSLRLSGKRMEQALVTRIGATEQTAVPLYLKTLMEELRIFGSHEQLQKRADDYLEATTVETLFDKVLCRLETDYDPDRTREAMMLLWASRHGLSEPELLDLLGQAESPLPGAYWSPLYLAIRESLVDRSEVLSFFHSGLRDAVCSRYLADPSLQEAAHRRLAVYFERLGPTPTRRQIEELPWQLRAVKEWQTLAHLLVDPAFFMAAWSVDPFEVKNHWAQIEANSNVRLADACGLIALDDELPVLYLWRLAVLLSETGYDREAARLNDHVLTTVRGGRDPQLQQASLGLAAILLHRQGDMSGAMASFAEQEDICRRIGDRAALAACLNGQGVVLRDRKELSRAMDVYRCVEEICTEFADLHGRADSLGNQAIVKLELGDAAGASLLLREQEQICRQTGDLSGLQKSLGNQAALLRTRNRHEEALLQHREEEAICRRINDLAGLQVCLINQALANQDLADYDAAFDLFDQCEQICRNQRDDPFQLARVLLKKATLLSHYLRLPEQALPLAEEAYELAKANVAFELMREAKAHLDESCSYPRNR